MLNADARRGLVDEYAEPNDTRGLVPRVSRSEELGACGQGNVTASVTEVERPPNLGQRQLLYLFGQAVQIRQLNEATRTGTPLASKSYLIFRNCPPVPLFPDRSFVHGKSNDREPNEERRSADTVRRF
jgi:hypothetical protein